MRCHRCGSVYCSEGCHEKDWDLHRESCRPPLTDEGTRDSEQAEQGDAKVNLCVAGKEAKTIDEAYNQWCDILGPGGVSEREAEREQIQIKRHLRDMELEQEKWEQEEEARVFKAKVKKNRDGEKSGRPKLNNYCRIIGLCGFCNKVAEYRCERCGMVCCSQGCYEENWETH